MKTTILFLMDSPNYKGGAHFATFNTIKLLHRNDFDISILSPVVPDKKIKGDLPYVKFIKSGKNVKTNEKSILKTINLYDMVCLPFENSKFRDVASRSNVYKIFWIHMDYRIWKNVNTYTKEITANDRVLFNNFDKIVCVSKIVETGFLLLYPELCDKTTVCYNLLDINKIKHLAVLKDTDIDNEKKFKIVTVSRMQEMQKGIRRTLNIIKKLKDEQYNFTWEFVGGGENFEEMRNYSSQLGLNTHIKWVGYTDNPYKHIKNADLLALFSYYEAGNPLVVYEALIIGTPVISTHYHASEGNVPANAGWRVNNDEKSIYEGLKNLLDNKELVKKAKNELIDYEYDVKKYEGKILDVFNKTTDAQIRKIIRVSIIVPVYNVELYLKECLDSLVAQTLQEIEIIVVDDGSTDGSPAIIKEYEEKYPNKIIGVRKENGGLGDARNYGLKYAKGQYVAFVDSDDWAENNMFELMFEKAMSDDYDIIQCDIYIVDNKMRYTVIGKSPYAKEGAIAPKEAALRSTRPVVVAAWAKLYKREIFDSFKFPFGWYEDLAVMPAIVTFFNKIYYLCKPLYYYRQNREGAITYQASQRKDPKILDIIKARQSALNMANQEFQQEISFAIYEHACITLKNQPWLIKENMDFIVKNKDVFSASPYVLAAIQNGELPNHIKGDVIPKVIHYCWFGGNPKSEQILRCMETWRKHLPDYEIIEWNESNCDIANNKYASSAYNAKKWAFVADYFRFKILYEHGGIYLDTDMLIHKSLDGFLHYNVFFPMECYEFVCGGVIGAAPKSEIIKRMLDQYADKEYKNGEETICHKITRVFVNEYEYRKTGNTQMLKDNIAVFSPNVMIINISDGKNYCEHLYDASWVDNKSADGATYRNVVLRKYFYNLQSNLTVEDDLVYDTKKILDRHGAKRVIIRILKERISKRCPLWFIRAYKKIYRILMLKYR